MKPKCGMFGVNGEGVQCQLTTEMTDGAPETLQPDQNGSAPFGPANGSAAVACDKPESRSVEYHLEWSKNSGTWYFGGMIRNHAGAILALQQERRNSAKDEEGKVEWRIVRQIKERHILTD